MKPQIKTLALSLFLVAASSHASLPKDMPIDRAPSYQKPEKIVLAGNQYPSQPNGYYDRYGNWVPYDNHNNNAKSGYVDQYGNWVPYSKPQRREGRSRGWKRRQR